MSRTDFDDFVKRKRALREDAAVDRDKQLADWREYLDVLYTEIKSFLKKYIDDGTAKIEFRPIELNEEFSGPYEATQMLLHISTSIITFRPVGTMLIGTKGRVDVQGSRGGARLSLIDRKVTEARQLVRVTVSINGEPPPPAEVKPYKIDWVWKIITPPPEMKFLDLNEDNFFDMILGIADA